MNSPTAKSVIALLLASAATIPLTPTDADASIVSVSGQTTLLGSPPADCTLGQLAGFNAFAWDEQQNVSVSSGIFFDMVNNPATNATAIPGVLAGTFDSHFLHWEAIPGVVGAAGTVTFSGQILGVEFIHTDLDITDPILGSFGTTYPTGFPFRDITFSNSSFSINNNVLSYNFFISPVQGVVEVRVVTGVPAPGVASVAGLMGLAAVRRRRRA
ncbi:MAG TPA: hypothetical protein VG797_03165 [Phycisphaerales bacterium]|nr:hypothetical protein [Phycisphaerales bacterium]